MIPFKITSHAIERFRQRFVPDMTHHDAMRQLYALAPYATKLEEKSPLGQDMWTIDPPGVILVCKTDPTVGVVAVTSLTARMKGPSQDDIAELEDAARRNMVAPVAPDPLVAWTRPAKVRKTAEELAQGIVARDLRNAKQIAEAAERKKELGPRLPKCTTGERQRKHFEALLLAERAKRTTHVDHVQCELDKIKRCLRSLMRASSSYVGIDSAITESWDAIAGESPGLVTARFLGPKAESRT